MQNYILTFSQNYDIIIVSRGETLSQTLSYSQCNLQKIFEKLFELDPELAKGAKKARQAPRKPTAYQFTQREKKAKPEKAQICSAMIEGLNAIGIADLNVLNEEREFTFTLNGTKYKVTLACPRK